MLQRVAADERYGVRAASDTGGLLTRLREHGLVTELHGRRFGLRYVLTATGAAWLDSKRKETQARHAAIGLAYLAGHV